MAGFEILDPTVEPRRQPLTYVPRPDSLKGKRIGLVENTKYNSWVPAHAELIEDATRTVDVVVAGVGD